MLGCVRTQDEQRDILLASVHKQLHEYLAAARQNPPLVHDQNFQTRVRQGLHPRLSLVRCALFAGQARRPPVCR